MTGSIRQLRLAFCCLLTAILLCGCATPNVATTSAPAGVFVLLPEGDKPSGEVTVSNASGTRVLNQSWQSVAVTGSDRRPEAPVLLAGTPPLCIACVWSAREPLVGPANLARTVPWVAIRTLLVHSAP